VSIDFAYAQARAQARLGERLSEAGWRVIESLPGLAQYLASLRNSVLAPHVRHFSAAVTIHTIDRALRDDWRVEVAAIRHWAPEPWMTAVAWTAWLPYLDPVAWLIDDNRALAWMHDDTVLRELAIDELSARRLAIANSPFGVLAHDDASTSLKRHWFERWKALWPPSHEDEITGLEALVSAVRRYLAANREKGERPDARRGAIRRLETYTTGLIHHRTEEPVVIFCHLLLVALDLQRLRDGLLRRALFRDVAREQAA
jgi:hypothetical protein